ncbi:hypothetical protein EH223_16125 [candidate division KSB1 bacterium]|nr:hypothetical protein [candidate division KSB1 bacterium]RQW01054.1 MAG: hypothetical protein EH223_16125 [candidate division KSB1 bacterium]
MFKVLRAELLYYRTALLFYALFCTVAFCAIWFGIRIEANKIPSIMLILLVTVLSVGNIQSGFFIKSKRLRWLFLLPIARSSFGDIRFLFPLAVWLGTLILYTMLYVVVAFVVTSPVRPHLTHILLVNGLILLTQSMYLYNIDIRHIIRVRSVHMIVGILWFITFVLILVPFYVLVNFAGLFGQSSSLQNWLFAFMNSPTAVLPLNVAGYFTYRASYYVFQLRGQFLE